MSLDFNPMGYSPDGVAIFGDDSKALVKFFTHPEISRYKTHQSGVPIYDDVVMIEMLVPGEKDPIRVLATPFHKARFPKQWENFEKGIAQTGVMSGTPLEMLFPNEPSTVLALKGINVFNIQQLAALTDTGMQNVPMGRSLVDRAKSYLSTAEHGSQFHQMEKTIADLQSQLAQLQEAGAAPVEQVRRGPGRPPKAAGETA